MISCCQELGGREGRTGGAQGIFKAVKLLEDNFLWIDTTRMDTYGYIVVQTHECTTSEVNPGVDCGL